jgi:hypothetical protein
MLIKVLMQLLVGNIDAELQPRKPLQEEKGKCNLSHLFKAVAGKVFEAKYIKNSNVERDLRLLYIIIYY